MTMGQIPLGLSFPPEDGGVGPQVSSIVFSPVPVRLGNVRGRRKKGSGHPKPRPPPQPQPSSTCACKTTQPRPLLQAVSEQTWEQRVWERVTSCAGRRPGVIVRRGVGGRGGGVAEVTSEQVNPRV